MLVSRMVALHLCSRRVGESSWGKKIRHLNACHADVCHPIVNVESVRQAKIVSPVDTRRKYDVSDDSAALQR